MGCFFSSMESIQQGEKKKKKQKERVGLYQEARRRSTHAGKKPIS